MKKSCFLCKDEGHFIRNCPRLEEAQAATDKKGRGKGKKKFFKKKIATIDEGDEEGEENGPSAKEAGN